MLTRIFNSIPAPYLRFRKTAWVLWTASTVIPTLITFAPALKTITAHFGLMAAPEPTASILPSVMQASIAGTIWGSGYLISLYLAASYACAYLGRKPNSP